MFGTHSRQSTPHTRSIASRPSPSSRPAQAKHSVAAFAAPVVTAGLLAACGATGTAHLPRTCSSGPRQVAAVRAGARLDPAGSTVTLTAPGTSCGPLRVYTVQYLLDRTDREWTSPGFVDTLSSGRTVNARIPDAAGTCTASAVIAVPDDVDLDAAARTVLADFRTWPGTQRAVVPTSGQLSGDGSYVVAGTLKDRPEACRPGAGPTAATTTTSAGGDTVAAPADPAGCEYQAIGAALRPTVKVAGSTVTVSPGALSCADGVAVYVADYTLTSDPADEPKATPAGTLFPGSSPVTLSFPASFAQCRATAVYFDTISADSEDTRLSIRQELARWPSSSRAVAPDASYVARYPKTRILLARNISGLGACRPDGSQKVTIPVAAIKDCWAEGPASQPGAPEYAKVDCSGEHVYEVYYATSISFSDYLVANTSENADTWAKSLAQQRCQDKQSSMSFTGNYRLSSLTTTYVWPSSLDLPGVAGSDTTSRDQIICLVHRIDLQPVSKRILR